MNGQPRSNRRPVVIRWAIILAITVLVFLWIMHGARANARIFQNARRARVRQTEADLLSAMKTYSTEYGYSVTGDPAQILAVLRGDNQRKIIFIEIGPERFNSKGELLDSWGMPYRFDFSKPDAPRVWSCGPNRKDEGGAEGTDDIVSWR